MKKLTKFLSLLTITTSIFTSCLSELPLDEISIKQYPTDGIQEISADLSYESIEIKKSNDDQIRLEIKSNTGKKLPKVYVENSKLCLKTTARNSSFGHACTVTVYIPANFYSKNYNIETSSGYVLLDNLESDNFLIETSSGAIKLLSLSTPQTINAKASSGAIKVQNANCNYLKLKTSSGAIKSENTKCKYFDAKASSGAIKFDVAKQIESNSSIKTSSGSVKLSVPIDMNFQIRASTSSGRFRDKINDSSCKPNNMLTKYNNGGTEIKIETNSGKIVVED